MLAVVTGLPWHTIRWRPGCSRCFRRHCWLVSQWGGGCIHRAWQLQLADGRRFFAKTNGAAALPMLQAEAAGLQALAAAADADLVVPRPLHCALVEGEALMVLPWLTLVHGGTSQAWSDFGAGLARLHRRSAAGQPQRFGWSHDNFIGTNPQRNGWQDRWGRFFAERRLGVQLELAAAKGKQLRGGEQLLADLPGWLDAHDPDPCLVHGDLWSGNAALLQDPPLPALFDPAVYRGDREVDLAMARLFGGFPADFFLGYGRAWPLPPGDVRRRHVYDLYHLLNHANLFGGGYWRQAQELIDRLI